MYLFYTVILGGLQTIVIAKIFFTSFPRTECCPLEVVIHLIENACFRDILPNAKDIKMNRIWSFPFVILMANR